LQIVASCLTATYRLASEQELLAHPWCQTFTRRYLDGEREPEVAVLVPRSLVTEPDGADARRKQDALDVL
jgi:hypothetical protein